MKKYIIVIAADFISADTLKSAKLISYSMRLHITTPNKQSLGKENDDRQMFVKQNDSLKEKSLKQTFSNVFLMGFVQKIHCCHHTFMIDFYLLFYFDIKFIISMQ